MKTRYIIALAACALALAGCQSEELAEPGVLPGKDGVVKFEPSVGGILSGVKSSASEDAAATFTQSLALASEDGSFTLPMDLSVTSMEACVSTKAALINENGGITDAEFAMAIENIFYVAAWNNATPPARIPDNPTGDALKDYVSGSDSLGWYQKVAYRDGAGSVKYWMTVQKQTASVTGAPNPADDEYIWKKNETKTFYAYANVPAGTTVALLAEGAGQTLTCTNIPAQDVLMGYYTGNGSTGSPAKQTGTASIQFHHPLAAVKVKKGTVADGVTIKSVAIENVYGKGELMVKQEDDSFTWTRSDSTPFKDENLVESISVTCDGEAVLVLPQTFPAKARISVTLEQGGQTFNVYSPLSGSWSNGTLYTYTIGYNPPPEDLLPGKFSVSATEYVQFSRGNLLATRSSSSSNDWKLCFFENQYDFGKATSFSANDTEMSLFTFGFNSKETSFNPIGFTPGSEDWGNEYNRQYGLLLGTWQTLTGGTDGEWWYLLEGRPNAANLKEFKTVHEHSNCLIILPDDFDLSDMPSSAKLTDAEWLDLEKKGAVCLPQAGYRSATTYSTESNGYWANNSVGASLGYGAFFNGASVTSTNAGSSNYGYSIRLVQKFDRSVSEISLSSSSDKRYKNSGSFKLTATLVPKDAKAQLQWTSSDENVATVDDNGEVTIRNTGNTVITCKDSYTEVYATCTLSVCPIQDKSKDNLSKNFTVDNSGKKVQFARGNLYFNGSAFDFETNQYDCRTYVGKDAIINGVYSATGTPENTWGLFGFSVDRDGNNYGMSTSEDWNEYNNYNCDFKDWGGAVTSYDGTVWRTLDRDEWAYILHERENNSILRGWAKVNGVNGVILLPDDFQLPGGCEFDSNKQGDESDGYNWSKGSYNIYDIDAWSKMENAGAVFLPAVGFRSGETINYWQKAGSYFSATKIWEKLDNTFHWLGYNVYYITMSINGQTSFCNVSDGSAVRLITEAQD